MSMVSNDSNDDLTKLVVAQQEQIAELTKLVTTLVIASGPVLTKSHDDDDDDVRSKLIEDAVVFMSNSRAKIINAVIEQEEKRVAIEVAEQFNKQEATIKLNETLSRVIALESYTIRAEALLPQDHALTWTQDDLDYRTSELQIRLKNAEDALCAL